ncbi:hypothetical protein A2524_04225 [Candidatus Wolfebacteria bacterium RIFOXYD12_FULL_48_21]|nr:MAG: hypothetical protein A2524_04225 [Candidatus Wolfebacteria bacterium RIFOXYD12_FULL_48_21]OGM97694.1 MAG: hypothetical protein A2532_04400 [Candidatus Wolfebacteria bacterium RIFOXYD2_FULL_48_11]
MIFGYALSAKAGHHGRLFLFRQIPRLQFTLSEVEWARNDNLLHSAIWRTNGLGIAFSVIPSGEVLFAVEESAVFLLQIPRLRFTTLGMTCRAS